MTNPTVREIRQRLFDISAQDLPIRPGSMTVRQIRNVLFEQTQQDVPLVDEELLSLANEVLENDLSERIVSEACRLSVKYGPLVGSRKASSFARLYPRGSERRLFLRAVSKSISSAYAGQALTAETK